MLRRAHACSQEGSESESGVQKGKGENLQRNGNLSKTQANELVGKIDKWLGGNYKGFPESKNVLTGLKIPVGITIGSTVILPYKTSEDDFTTLAFHEKLHVYINEKEGALNYLFSGNHEEVHDWIRGKAGDLTRSFQGYGLKGAGAPDINDYPRGEE